MMEKWCGLNLELEAHSLGTGPDAAQDSLGNIPTMRQGAHAHRLSCHLRNPARRFTTNNTIIPLLSISPFSQLFPPNTKG